MKNKTLIYVLIAIVLAITTGIFTGTTTAIFGITFFSIFDFLGKLFLNALMLLIIPLVSSSIVTGISKLGKENSFQRVGIKTFLIFLLTNLLAILVGILLINIFKETFVSSAQLIEKLKAEKIVTPVIDQNIQKTASLESLKILFLQIIPQNVFKAFSEGQMLGIIFFSILFGFVITKIKTSSSTLLQNFFQSIFDAMIHITHLVMKLLPFGVFFLVAKEFAATGFHALKTLGFFSSLVLAGMAIHFFIILPLLLLLLGRVRPFAHFRAMFSALITGFSTSSSAAALPITIDCLEKNANISNKICSLVAPLGTSINSSATAMYVFIASSFLASAYQVELHFYTQAMIFLLSFVTTLGVAAVPSGSVIIIIIILKALHLPIEAIGLIFVVDRFLDMFRTTTNIFTVSTSTLIIARWEGEKNILQKK